MPLPQRAPGSAHLPPGQSAPVYEVVKARVLHKLHDRLDPSKSRRGRPASLLLQSARQQVELVIDVEGPRLSRSDRERMLEEVLGEVFGYGPLEELLRDPATEEVLVLGPGAVIVRREQGWVPTNVKFRDEDQLRLVLGRAALYGQAVGATLPDSVLDARLTNGWRVVAVIPPPVLDRPATAVFTRAQPEPQPQAAPPDSRTGTAPSPVTVSGTTPVPTRTAPTAPDLPSVEQQMARHRARITERIIAKMASLGVYDLAKLDLTELRRVVAAFVREYCAAEHLYLSDTDQGRLMLEILTGMNR